MLRSHGVKPAGSTGRSLSRKQYIDKFSGNIAVKDITKKSGRDLLPHKMKIKKLKEFLGYKKGGFVSNKPNSAGLAKRGWGAVSR